MPAALFFVLLIVAAWDVTKTAVKAQHADYKAHRQARGKPKGTKGRQPVTGSGKAQPRHRAGYWGREVAHGFPVARTAWHTGWLAHRTAAEHQKARREEARTSSLEQRASLLTALREHRERQHKAHEEIQYAIKAMDQPPKGRREVREAVGKVLPFPVRDPDADPPLPSDGVGKPQPGPYARPADDGAAHLKALMPDPRLNDTQRERDADPRLRNACAACGHDGTDEDPLAVHPDGFRVHESHITDPDSGLYVPPGDGSWPTGVPHRRNGDAPSPAVNGGNTAMADVTYDQALDQMRSLSEAADGDLATIRQRRQELQNASDAMQGADVDSASLGEVMDLIDRYTQLEADATACGEQAAALHGNLQARHGGLAEAHQNAPVTAADKDFYAG